MQKNLKQKWKLRKLKGGLASLMTLSLLFTPASLNVKDGLAADETLEKEQDKKNKEKQNAPKDALQEAKENLINELKAKKDKILKEIEALDKSEKTEEEVEEIKKNLDDYITGQTPYIQWQLGDINALNRVKNDLINSMDIFTKPKVKQEARKELENLTNLSEEEKNKFKKEIAEKTKNNEVKEVLQKAKELDKNIKKEKDRLKEELKEYPKAENLNAVSTDYVDINGEKLAESIIGKEEAKQKEFSLYKFVRKETTATGIKYIYEKIKEVVPKEEPKPDNGGRKIKPDTPNNSDKDNNKPKTPNLEPKIKKNTENTIKKQNKLKQEKQLPKTSAVKEKSQVKNSTLLFGILALGVLAINLRKRRK